MARSRGPVRRRYLNAAKLVPLLGMAVVLSGCGSPGSPGSDTGAPAPPQSTHAGDDSSFESSYRPVTNASPGRPLERGREPVGLVTALRAATDGRDRSAGEAAAREFAKVVVRAEPDSPPGEVELTAIAAPSMPPAVRNYLVHDTDGQRGLRTGRHYDTSRGGYYRSQVTGPDAAPAKVSLELAALMRAPGLDHQAWYATRYDVTWVTGDGWRLSDFSDGRFGPYTTTLSRTQREQYLSGAGWRELR